MAEFFLTQLNNFRTHDRIAKMAKMLAAKIINPTGSSIIASYPKSNDICH